MSRARVPLITVTAAIAVAACSSCGGNAYAQGDVIVSPPQARPGMEVEIRTGSCDGDWATARSEAFTAEAQMAPSPDGFQLWGEARVRQDAQPRQYDVRVRCDDGKQLTGRLTVSGGQPGPSPTWSHHDNWRPQPWRPVHAGGGGAAQPGTVVEAAPSEEPDTLAAVRGAAVSYADELALGAGAATLIGFAGRRLWIRRRVRD
ncbi:hypothetical protein AB0M28_39825 [Streptomyces sp. NPDC051940]|uniref:hypothetical protein n=1 Tax=Streptomyces sp. NPDC051940 TaxID=3155675 RepID=UPI00343A33D1